MSDINRPTMQIKRSKSDAHGTAARYTDPRIRCRCEPCRRAALIAAKRRERRRLQEGPAHIDNAAARRHLAFLAGKGLTSAGVARISGVPLRVIQRIASGETPRSRHTTVRKLLAVSAAHRPDNGFVPAAPTLARLAELEREGWTRRQIAKHLGLAASSSLPTADRLRVRAATERTIAELHRRLMAPIEAAREQDRDRQRRWRHRGNPPPVGTVRYYRQAAA